MTRTFEKRWWFELPCYLVATLLVQALFRAAGVENILGQSGFSFARMAIWGCCFYVIENTVSFSLWLLVLTLAPGGIAGRD